MQQTPAPVHAEAPKRTARISDWWEDLGAALLGVWIVVALYLDGRAHLLGLPDSFFTPWHGALYGGLVLLTGWLGLMVWRGKHPRKPADLLHIPTGYGWALAGVAVFASGGLADMLWHAAFGLEVGIDALLSPSHLLLFAGAVLMFSGPVLAARAKADLGRGMDWTLLAPVLLALAAMTGVAMFALSYLSGFIADAPLTALRDFPEGTPEHITDESQASVGLGSYLLTSLILTVPLVYLARNWRLAVGMAGFLLTSQSVLAMILTDFGFVGPVLIPAMAAAGLVVDLALWVARTKGASARIQALLAAAILPVVMVTAQLATMGASPGLGWSPELVVGVVLLSGMLSTAVTVLMVQVPVPGRGSGAPPGLAQRPRVG